MAEDRKTDAGDAGGGSRDGAPEKLKDVDPADFLRALLKISPEDAETARAEAARRGTKSDG
jgi:hypothetical protein